MAGRQSLRASPGSSRRARPAGAAARFAEEIAGLQQASETVIYEHVFTCADREVGGVLVGRLAADGGPPLVTGAIPAISADEQRATLTFTQEAWAHVHRELETAFPPDEQIVGWYHSHPGFGIFLSGHDQFIHQHFFSSPSQIAVVVDPLARREGVFVWREAKLVALFERATPGAWTSAPPTHEARARSGDTVTHPEPSRRDGYPWLALAIAAVIGMLLGFGLWSVAEGGGQAQPARGAASHGTHRARPTPSAADHIEVREE
jgi:proteasome lid subunit RPN8/RPN11